MSQSFSAFPPSPSHSWILLNTSGCSGVSRVQRSRKSITLGSDKRKNRCSDERSSGFAPVIVEYGLTRSVGALVCPHFSQPSPAYWPSVPHFGQVPLM